MMNLLAGRGWLSIPLTIALSLASTACGDSRAPAATPAGGAEPTAGSWKTWVLESGSDIKVPPPPVEGSVVGRAEERTFQAMIARRDEAGVRLVNRFQDPIEPWVAFALRRVSERVKDPPAASRAYGYVSVAMYDAMVAAYHWKYRYERAAPSGIDRLAPAPTDPSYPSAEAAMAGAASRVLAHLFPEASALRLDQRAEQASRSRVLAGVSYPSDVQAGLDLGRKVAERVIARARRDGFARKWNGKIPSFRGVWRPPPGSVALPVQPLAGRWKTWVMSSGGQFRAPPPPRYGSTRYMKECEEVMRLGRSLTPEQKEIATYWAGGQGTPLPPGIWDQIGLRFIERYGLNVPRAARLMALLNVAQADAGVAAWDTKYAYWTVRPENAIRNLDMDPKWKPFIETPFFPAYVSGHAVYSGAGADVLSYLFPQDREEIQAKAREAGFSRILGGIHFRSDSVEGLKMGHKLGALVVAHARSDGADG